MAFSSGMAACEAVCNAFLQTGDHIICSEDCYGGTGQLFQSYPQLGITTSFVDMRLVDKISEAIVPGKTRIIWTETPTNPTLRITDIQTVADLIRQSETRDRIIFVVDNTFMSSYLQNPLSLGADIVMHSLTKYMNGHSDVVMGALMTNCESAYSKLKKVQKLSGAVPSAIDCFLVRRGLKTLPLRMRAHSNNAMRIATVLEQHPNVERVIYPGLQSHDQHEIAVRQSPKGFSSMVSFYVKSNDPKAAYKFVRHLKVFKLAASLGGVESLCNVPLAMVALANPDPQFLSRLGITGNLVRLSVGIETVDDLIKDLMQALDQIE